MPHTRYFLLTLIVAVALSACHNSSSPTQQSSNQSAAQNPVAGYPAGPDTSVSKPVVDHNAKDGMNIIKYKDGVIKAKGYFQAGYKEGEWQSFFESGKLQSDEFFTKGIPDGKVTVWYENGQKLYEGEFSQGKPINTWSYWDNSGKLIRTADYNKKAPNTAL